MTDREIIQLNGKALTRKTPETLRRFLYFHVCVRSNFVDMVHMEELGPIWAKVLHVHSTVHTFISFVL